MVTINWDCCPLVAQNPFTRAFIEQIAKERKAPSTIENYSRDLNDFCPLFPVSLFQNSSKLMKAESPITLISSGNEKYTEKQARAVLEGTLLTPPDRNSLLQPLDVA